MVDEERDPYAWNERDRNSDKANGYRSGGRPRMWEMRESE
jgi:hypothetical protein